MSRAVWLGALILVFATLSVAMAQPPLAEVPERGSCVQFSVVALEFSCDEDEADEVGAALAQEPPATVVQAWEILEDADVSVFGSASLWAVEGVQCELELAHAVALPVDWKGHQEEPSVATKLQDIGLSGSLLTRCSEQDVPHVVTSYLLRARLVRPELPQTRRMLTFSWRGCAAVDFDRPFCLVATKRIRLVEDEDDDEEPEESDYRLVGLLVFLQPRERTTHTAP